MHRNYIISFLIFLYSIKILSINFQQLGTSIGASFGFCPYTLSASFWNNFNAPILYAVQSIANVSGAMIWESYSRYPVKSGILQPFTQVTFSGSNAITNACPGSGIWLVYNWDWGTVNPLDYASWHSLLVQTLLGQYAIANTPFMLLNHQNNPQADLNVYTYNVYSNKGTPTAEFIGPNLFGGPYTTSTGFAGTFFNNTDEDISLTFPYGKTTYTVTLESQYFAILNPPVAVPFRSAQASFTFNGTGTTTTIPIRAEGLGMTYTDSNNQQQVAPVTYNYEIFSNNGIFDVGIQGFNIGNHNNVGFCDPPHNITITAIRDITPVNCHIWNQSALTASSIAANKGNQYIDLPGQLWFTYTTKDQTIQQEIPVSTASFNGITIIPVIRPQISEGPQHIYIFYIPSQYSDEEEIKQYLTNATKNIPTKNILYTQVPNLTTTSSLSSVAMIPVTHAKIYDSATNIIGTLVLIDEFQPWGMPTTDRYYTLPPSIFQPQIATELGLTLEPLVTQFIDLTLDPQPAQTYAKNILSWIADFNTHALPLLTNYSGNQSITLGQKVPTLSEALSNTSVIENAAPLLLQYIRQNGVATLFNPVPTSTQSRTGLSFSTQTYQSLYYLLYGPVSFASPPFLQQAGTNSYIYSGGKTPDGWPTA